MNALKKCASTFKKTGFAFCFKLPGSMFFVVVQLAGRGKFILKPCLDRGTALFRCYFHDYSRYGVIW